MCGCIISTFLTQTFQKQSTMGFRPAYRVLGSPSSRGHLMLPERTSLSATVPHAGEGYGLAREA